MKEVFIRILKVILITLFFIGGAMLFITTFFSEQIEKSVISKLQENLKAPLILDDVQFTIYENFPSASVKLTNLLVIESEDFNKDTLLFTKRAYVEIGLFDIINKNYNIKDIISISCITSRIL